MVLGKHHSRLAFNISFIFSDIHGIFGSHASFEELENPKSSLATEIISEDHEVLGNFAIENRTFVDFDELSPYIVNALIATEDLRFYDHSGVDPRGLARVAIRTVLLGDKGSGGGSTITQQLAKLLFHEPAKNIWERGLQKLNEWVIAVKLERSYTKNEILTMYLNKVGYIYDAYGIQSAAQTFFGVTTDSIKIEEAAVLIGMLKNPALFNPVRRRDTTEFRRNVVLNQMRKAQFIKQEEYDSLKNIPLTLKFRRRDHKEGVAPYFREYIRLTLNAGKPERKNYPPYLHNKFIADSVEWENNPMYGFINKNLKPDGTKYNIYRDGLKIYTTVNYKMQTYAESAVHDHLANNLQKAFFKEKKGRSRAPFTHKISEEQYENIINKAIRNSERYRTLRKEGIHKDSIMKSFRKPVNMQIFTWEGEKDTILTPLDSIIHIKHYLRASLFSIDPRNGHVKAYVGGPNFKYFMYDMATKGKRQVGSTIKPLVYTLAMQEGHTPCDLVPNIPQTFVLPDGKTWTPRDAGKRKKGEMVTLKWGLANSNNNISAWVMKQYNPEAVRDMIHELGILSPMDAVPSLCLGIPDFSLNEMVSAYSTFANKGVRIEPMMISRIVDRYGNVIGQFTPKKKEVISEQTAYLMLNLLQGVVNNGTGKRLRYTYHFSGQIGGKTGTTQNHSDGWFIGVTPNLTTGIWVGGEDRDIHFDGIRLGQGANMALPIWALYMKKVYADETLQVSEEDIFEEPINFNLTLDCDDNNGTNNEEDIDENTYTNGDESEFF
ncbi:transglycosylase domain-containing protein [Saccharicrinis fermentans]|uniref:Penicillin-binding protein 1A n=1 Tax=Saccharicrinis fermentans DSM 9555 = JCM 21142 TaxID=869213 RepID=W7Y711_9BACT|nr:transglycosylase domain-containing protein [Saccharicrinis fermentans]GAF03443.1 penicillin-binding protein 1A [Saccharicrinis fermentans DSM 9555 = JCM 21142]